MIITATEANVETLTVDNLTEEPAMGSSKTKSVIKRVYIPTQVRDLPNGEKLKIPGHYKAPPGEGNDTIE